MILTTVFLKRQSPSGEKWCACFVWAIVRTKVSAGIKIHEWFTQHLHHCWTGCDASATESKMITCLWCVSAASPCKIAALQSPISLSNYFRVTEIVSYLVLGSCDSMRTNVFSGVTWEGGVGWVFWLCLRRKINYIFSLPGQALCRDLQNISVFSFPQQHSSHHPWVLDLLPTREVNEFKDFFNTYIVASSMFLAPCAGTVPCLSRTEASGTSTRETLVMTTEQPCFMWFVISFIMWSFSPTSPWAIKNKMFFQQNQNPSPVWVSRAVWPRSHLLRKLGLSCDKEYRLKPFMLRRDGVKLLYFLY